MKIVIFGIGQWYYANKNKILCTDEIVAFLDNNEQYCGTVLENVKVYKPEYIKTLSYDKIVLMSIHAIQMRQQLLKLGCKKEDILRYDEYFALGFQKDIRLLSPVKVTKLGQKKILIITNPLGYHGGAITAVHAACALQNRNYEVVIASSKGDRAFIAEMKKKGISFLIYERLEFAKWDELEWIQEYQNIIVNTLPMIRCAIEIAKYRKVILWLHESEIIYPSVEYWKDIIVENLFLPELKIFAVSRVAKENFIRNYGECPVGLLRYGIPDMNALSGYIRKNDDYITFAMVGSIHPIKGQDIFLDAICDLQERYKKSKFLIVGSITDNKYGEKIKRRVNEIPNVTIHQEVEYCKMTELYARVDVLVVPSRQETMSLVATEAMMYGKPCIVSDVVGMADFIKDKENGFIFNINYVQELKEKMQWCMDHIDEISIIGMNARKTYEEYFTINSFEKQLENLL